MTLIDRGVLPDRGVLLDNGVLPDRGVLTKRCFHRGVFTEVCSQRCGKVLEKCWKSVGKVLTRCGHFGSSHFLLKPCIAGSFACVWSQCIFASP